MIGRFLKADCNAPDSLQEMAEAIRGWEPALDLYVLPPDARLFEPDGTLYAVSLAPTHQVEYHRTTRHVSLGDMIVVPAALALEVEPEIRMLGVRYDGPPPDHFRERFIQVWGFDHFRAAPGDGSEPSPSGVDAVIPWDDLRHRLIYEIWRVPLVAGPPVETGLAVTLLIGLDGAVDVTVPERDERVELLPGVVAAVGPGLVYRVQGEGRLGRLTLLTELEHLSRRREGVGKAPPPSPEYSSEGASTESTDPST